MNIELLEIQDFLSNYPPFNVLSGEVLAQVSRKLSIRYLRRGMPFPPITREKVCYLIRTGLIDIHDEEGKLHEKLNEGDLFIAQCGQNLQFTGIAAEDSLLYQLPCSLFQELKDSYPVFNAHFTATFKQATQASNRDLQVNTFEIVIKKIISGKPVSISPTNSILEATRLMIEQHLTCLPILSGDKLVGLVSDRDISMRCIVEKHSRDAPVEEIMTKELITIDSNQSAVDAQILMTQHNIRHLPVMEQDHFIGMVSSSDLLRLHTTTATKLVRMIHLASTVEDLANLSQKIPALQQQLVNTHMTAYRIGQVISSVADALTQRLIQLAEKTFGPAPIRYAWLAVGSLARQELCSHSDQDNALLLSNDYLEAQHSEYFTSLANFVCDGLNACGFFYCPGDVMASNPKWRQPMKVWQSYFTNWVKSPTPEDIMLACNFFDLRVISGQSSLLDQLLDSAIETARNDHIFLAHLALDATRHRPPLGFFRNFVLVNDTEHHDSFDIKLGGVLPITTLARLFSLSAGSNKTNTYERLTAAAQTSVLSTQGASDLTDALAFISSLRLRHQIKQYTEQRKMDNFILPTELSNLERHALKEAFSVINGMHKLLQQRYQMSH